jgi:dynein heavy chain
MSREQLLTMMKNYLDDYNNHNRDNLQMHMLHSTAEHINRLRRILSQPQGNALLLVGLGGEGVSVVKLAAYIAEYEIYELSVTRNYKEENWKNDLKKVMTKTGLLQRPLIFLCTDTEMNSCSNPGK